MPPNAKRRRIDGPLKAKRPTVAEVAEAESDASSSDGESQAAQTRSAYSSLLQSLGRSKGLKTIDDSLKVEGLRSTSNDGEDTESNLRQGEAILDDLEDDDSDGQVDAFGRETLDLEDPFESHFANPDESKLALYLDPIQKLEWRSQAASIKGTGRATVYSPGNTENDLPRVIRSVSDLKLKKRLQAPAEKLLSPFTEVQSGLASSLFSYTDILFGGRTPRNAAALRNMVCLHTLNHIFKTRDRVIKNNTRLSRDQSSADLTVRDQGFTRPKVLFLLETRQSCVRYMDTITRLCDPEQQENKKRFQDAFDQSQGHFSDDRPADFRELFDGNDDNDFRLGVKFTRKTIKYFSKFYNSDIIFASPLGLRRAMKTDDPKKVDYDFLSSIEVLVVDQADAMLFQNWEHVEHALDHLNLQPKNPHDCDFSRVRQYYLDNNSKHLRQSIVMSAYVTPELNSVFKNHMQNIAGKIRIQPEQQGTMTEVGIPVRQTFVRFDSKLPSTEPDERFNYFTRTIVPSLVKLAEATDGQGLGVLLFVPSYFDFVRLRNYFSSDAAAPALSVGSISEYDDVSEVRRARSYFLTGRYRVLLYSGRAHHFRRYKLRGVQKVIFFGLPENPIFYSEIAGDYLRQSIDDKVADLSGVYVKAMFSKWDSLALERIVGTKRVGRMLKDAAGDTFDFR